MRPVAVLLIVLLLLTSASSWKNGAKTTVFTQPTFGTHDYIAYKAYRVADPAKVKWLRYHLNAYFAGTGAPDGGPKPPEVTQNYDDRLQCHCILFDANGDVTKPRAQQRVREEFDKAKQAYAAGQRRLAAFYLGAMAHHLGDLSQFCHVMGAQSHWGSEDKTLHGAYEVAVESTIEFNPRRSKFLDPYITRVVIGGQTPEELALAVALHTETRNGAENPQWMHAHYTALRQQGKGSDPAQWDDVFRDKTGQNVAVSVNAIAQLLEQVAP